MKGLNLGGLGLVLVAVALLAIAAPARGDDVVKVFASANGVFYDDDVVPADFQLGGRARASLSEHISVVGAAWYRFKAEETHFEIGPRITATDVNNPRFSIGLGVNWRTLTDEWAPDAAIGWVPFPDRPAFVIGLRGLYGLDTEQAELVAAASLALWSGFNVGGGE